MVSVIGDLPKFNEVGFLLEPWVPQQTTNSIDAIALFILFDLTSKFVFVMSDLNLNDVSLTEKFKREYNEQFHILVRMHLSFLLDQTTDE